MCVHVCMCMCVPASSWPTLYVCAHHSSGPSCSPPGWWEHLDRSASPQASTSRGYFLFQKGKGEWRRSSELNEWKWRQGGWEGLYKGTGSSEWWCRTLLMMDRSADCFRQKCFSCTNPFSHQGHYGVCGHTCTHTHTRIALNLQTSHSNGMCLILKRSNLRTLILLKWIKKKYCTN